MTQFKAQLSLEIYQSEIKFVVLSGCKRHKVTNC